MSNKREYMKDESPTKIPYKFIHNGEEYYLVSCKEEGFLYSVEAQLKYCECSEEDINLFKRKGL